jgi:hypothetical protein
MHDSRRRCLGSTALHYSLFCLLSCFIPNLFICYVLPIHLSFILPFIFPFSLQLSSILYISACSHSLFFRSPSSFSYLFLLRLYLFLPTSLSTYLPTCPSSIIFSCLWLSLPSSLSLLTHLVLPFSSSRISYSSYYIQFLSPLYASFVVFVSQINNLQSKDKTVTALN